MNASTFRFTPFALALAACTASAAHAHDPHLHAGAAHSHGHAGAAHSHDHAGAAHSHDQAGAAHSRDLTDRWTALKSKLKTRKQRGLDLLEELRKRRKVGTHDRKQKKCRWTFVKENPDVTYTPADSTMDVQIAESGEVYRPVTDQRRQLHADAHNFQPLVTATLPPFFEVPNEYTIQDYALTLDDLVVINPAPDEFLWVMEGKRHGYEGLTIVLTDTQPGNGAPLHTHVGEESHVLLRGQMRYVLDGQEFVIKAPYIVNIPSMVPHAFMNVDDQSVQLVGIFPGQNEWSYDVLEGNPFAAAKALADQPSAAADCDATQARYQEMWFDAAMGGANSKASMPATPQNMKEHFQMVSAWHQPEHRNQRYKAHTECAHQTPVLEQTR